jgi:hypothetical protein
LTKGSTTTAATPARFMSSASAARGDRSRMRPRVYGPRSLDFDDDRVAVVGIRHLRVRGQRERAMHYHDAERAVRRDPQSDAGDPEARDLASVAWQRVCGRRPAEGHAWAIPSRRDGELPGEPAKRGSRASDCGATNTDKILHDCGESAMMQARQEPELPHKGCCMKPRLACREGQNGDLLSRRSRSP